MSSVYRIRYYTRTVYGEPEKDIQVTERLKEFGYEKYAKAENFYHKQKCRSNELHFSPLIYDTTPSYLVKNLPSYAPN